ncbi:MAG: right-handed parallel beta-helix repeat-containing protein [Gemmatimonadota bacterium]|nr:right-handed parallel beta-helix repeat-containing protein [Gemmatimonadota bacterium]
MNRPTTILALLALTPALTLAQGRRRLPSIALTPGLVITRSVRIVPRTYHLAAPASLDSALVTIRGDDVTVDFAGARLEGADPHADPDQAAGVAVRVDGGRNVRIVNAHIRGYKVAIMARGTHGLTLAGNDLSYNWKPRLYSVVRHESLLDWLSYHHNEHDEWLRYGAAIYLADVQGGEIAGNTAQQNMNGLMLVRSDALRIHDNTLSFNSGLGIGLYRSSRNTILHNRVDFDVRGYSHGFYNRGQDSAGLLMYEQSDSNVVAYNSVTHGGDGLFVWAGQTTMDTGLGGVNDNLYFGNDFSYAPTNGMEATFSRNDFIANRVAGSDHGLWGGYSYDSKIVANCLIGDRWGISIEHGQSNLILNNRITGGMDGVQLWANFPEPADWGYPKRHETHSQDYRIAGNTFAGNHVALSISNTARVAVTGNRFLGVDTVAVLKDTSGYRFAGNDEQPAGPESRAAETEACDPQAMLPREYARLAPPAPAADRAVPSSALTRRDRSAIVVDDWGPYDWKSPRLWPVDSAHENPLRLAVLGPPGRWTVAGRRGVAKLSATSGKVGDTLVVAPASDSAGDWSVTLEYRGAATVSPRGERLAAGRPYTFSYGRFEPAADWDARFFVWTDGTDPRAHPAAFDTLLAGTPRLTRHETRLDYEWYGPAIKALPIDRWALDATTAVDLAPGKYTIRTISDDAVRVWVDDTLAIDDWAPHGSQLDTATIPGGKHRIHVEYFQVDGWTEFRLDILRGVRTFAQPPG